MRHLEAEAGSVSVVSSGTGVPRTMGKRARAMRVANFMMREIGGGGGGV